MHLFYKYNSWTVCRVTYFILDWLAYYLLFLTLFDLIWLFLFWNHDFTERKLLCSFLRTFFSKILNKDVILLTYMREKEVGIIWWWDLILLWGISWNFLFWKGKILSLFDRFRFWLIQVPIYTTSQERISRYLYFRFIFKKLINLLNIFFLSICIMLTFNIHKPLILWRDIFVNT